LSGRNVGREESNINVMVERREEVNTYIYIYRRITGSEVCHSFEKKRLSVSRQISKKSTKRENGIRFLKQ